MTGLAQVIAGLTALADRTADSADRTAELDVLAAAEAALAAARGARGEMEARHRAELAAAERAIRAIEAGVVKLRAATVPSTRSASRQAGPSAIRMVTKVLAGGPASQKEIVKGSGLNEGTASYAVRALREVGAVELTGRRIAGSRELRLVEGSQAAVADLYEQARGIVAGAPEAVKS